MNFSRLDALCQEAEREAPRKAPNGAKRPTTESNAAAPSLDDFMRMFDEEDARSSGRPVGTDIVSNSQEEDEDGDLAHVFFEEFPDGLLEVRPGSLQPLDAPSEATKPLVPSAPVVPKPDRAKRGRGGFSAAMARPSAEEHGTLEPSALRQKEGDEKLAHDMDVLEGKEHSQKYKKAESTMPSMEELLGKLEAEEGTHLAERSKNELPKKTDKAPGDVAQDAVKAEAGIFSNFGQRRFDAIEAATVESKRRKEAEAELFGRLASERQRAEKGQGETEERSDLQERLARLKAQQAADWDQDEKASVAAQASQAKLEKERKQAKERRKRAGNNRTCEETPVAQACVEEEEGREADEEARRLEEEQKEQERRRVEEEARIEAERQEAERARLEQERKEEERKKAEEARRLEEEQKEQERRRVEEEARIEAERQEAERARLEQERKEEERREAEEVARRLEEQQKEQERRRVEEEAGIEAERQEAERARLEQERKEEERRKAEEEEEARRLEEEQKEQERRRVEEEARIEAERQEAERARLEQERKEEERREAEEVARRLEEQQKEQADAALSVEVEPPQEVAQGQPGRRRRAGFSAMVMQTAPGEARKSSQAVEAELQGAELLSDPARPPEEAVDANQEIPSVEALLQMLAEEDSPQESAPTVTASAVEDPSERQVAAELAASSVASEKAVQEPRPSGRRRKGFSTALQALPKEEVQEPTDAVPSMEALLAMLDAQ